MKRTATRDPRRTPRDAGFTLAEVMAGLFIAALLVSGLGELGWRVAHSTVRIHSDIELSRALRVAQAAFNDIQRANPQTIVVTDDEVTASIGSRRITFRLSAPDGASQLEWTVAENDTPPASRRIRVPPACFHIDDSIVLLTGASDPVPLLIAHIRRQLAQDCQFDPVIRSCR